ncbi:hypothetical protein COCON_G00213050 [Conger conger]|uniref:Large ribosomal subunit protein P2 n=2 Tax=Conger conger TaxID=82655 RepID=A0A9Q1CXA3_CONCO|nr:hypothetical protein COCON_G00213050 [Conger conger]
MKLSHLLFFVCLSRAIARSGVLDRQRWASLGWRTAPETRVRKKATDRRREKGHSSTISVPPTSSTFRFQKLGSFLSATAIFQEARFNCFSVKMRYVAAYLLAALGGNNSPQAKDIKKILESVGIEADDTRMEKVITELDGKNVEEVIAQGYGKLASVPSGGAVAVASSAAPGGGVAADAPAAEEKKEEKKEESEESEDDMGFGLFD